ncbi:AAA family ATPase [Comamonas thiooxydans]|nr:AAA family ATPase [Comamonas thiooxydans]
MTGSGISPWLQRFDGLVDASVLRTRVETWPGVETNLLQLPVKLAVLTLESAFKRCIVLSNQELQILLKLLERSHAYVAAAYPDHKEFLKQMHREELELPVIAPLCLTGLAGVGKSTLLTAFQRALPVSGEIDGGARLINGTLPVESCVRIKVDTVKTLTDLLQPWLPQEVNVSGNEIGKKKPKNNLDVEIKRAAKWSYRIGLSASIVDEMQFLSLGSDANAQITKFLLMLTHLKVPLVYAANFSLCHKLMKRHQEDRDRLLADVVVLKPLELNDQGLGLLLKAYSRILAEYLDNDLSDFIEEYSIWTLGIRRKVQKLTLAGFEVMLKSGERRLKVSHLKKAYQESMSRSYRLDIEILCRQSGNSAPVRGHMDLWCPFGKEFNQLDIPVVKMSNARASQISTMLLKQSLNAREKSLLAAFESPSRPSPSSDLDTGVQAKIPSSKRSTKKPGTAEELLRNTIRHSKK